MSLVSGLVIGLQGGLKQDCGVDRIHLQAPTPLVVPSHGPGSVGYSFRWAASLWSPSPISSCYRQNMSRGASVTFLKWQQDQDLNPGLLSVQCCFSDVAFQHAKQDHRQFEGLYVWP